MSRKHNMILFLEYSAGGRRGGEHFTGHLHSFLKRNLGDIYPPDYSQRPQELEAVLGAAKSSIKLVKELSPDLIVADVSSGSRNVMAVRWMKKRGGKILVIVQDQRMTYKFSNFSPVKWFIQSCERYLVRHADVLVVNSEHIAGLSRKMAKRNIPTVIARPGMELPRNHYVGRGNIEERGNAPMQLLSAGEPSKRKGTLYLIQAMSLLKDLNVRLHITGSFYPRNSYCRKLTKLIEHHGLADRIIFHGYIERSALIDLYQSCSLFVLPSLSEGYGIALAEALYFGLPVIATNVAAIPELITDGVNGLLVPPADPRALADAIRIMASDTKMYERISRENCLKAATLPRWEDFDNSLAKGLLPLLRELL